MYNHQLVYKVVIWAFFEISLWKEKVALSCEQLKLMSTWVTNQSTLWWGYVLWLWVHGFWCRGYEFYDRTIAFNLKVYEHKFMNTIESTKKGPHHGYNRKYMEVEGLSYVWLDHCSHVTWIIHLPRRQYDVRLSIHSGDICITV